MTTENGQSQRKRTPKELIGDVLAYVSSASGLSLLVSVATGASRSPVLWGCGLALIVLFVCVLFWRYDVVGMRPRWRPVALFSVMAISGIAVPVVGILQMTILRPPPAYPREAAVQHCAASGTVGSNQHGPPPPEVPDYLSLPAYQCTAKSSTPGDVPVYLAPGDRDTVGELNGDDLPWFVCRDPGRGASAWYYTQGGTTGKTDYPEQHAWGVVASSLPPDLAVPVCTREIQQSMPSGSS